MKSLIKVSVNNGCIGLLMKGRLGSLKEPWQSDTSWLAFSGIGQSFYFEYARYTDATYSLASAVVGCPRQKWRKSSLAYPHN